MRIAAVLALTLLARVAHADGDAEKLYQEGQTAYDAKQYDEAIAAWDKAYALSKLPGLVFNLAQAHRLAGHCEKAVDAYKRFLTLDPQSAERPDAEQFLKELEPSCPNKPVPQAMVKTAVFPDLRFEDRGKGKRRAGLIVGGTGLAVFAAGLYFGSRASSLASEVDDACAMGCEWTPELADKESSGKSAQTLQYVLYAVGAVGVAGGAALYFKGDSQRRIVIEQPKTGSGAVVGLAGRF
jgi:tetratricopeptide (TPR) repeat protein